MEEIEYNRAIVFPTYSESWLGGSSAKSDINGDFVQKRRVDLQVVLRCSWLLSVSHFPHVQNFFHSLFCQYPMLLEHPKVVELLEV